MRNLLMLLSATLLAGCGSFTVPAAVKLSDGTAMIGTATASMSGGTFEVSEPSGPVSCSGTYNALDTSPTINVPVRCSDGRHGTATVTRSRDGMSGRGTVEVSDGGIGEVAFGNNAGAILSTRPAFSPALAATATLSPAPRPSVSRRYIRGPRGGCYYLTGGNNRQYVDRSLCR